MLNLPRSTNVRALRIWIGLWAVIALSGCATGLVSSWQAPDAEPFRLQGEKVAAVVITSDQTIRLAGEDAFARELSARGAEGVPMYTLLAGAVPDEAKVRAAAERAGVVGVVVLRPVRVDKEISSRPTYSGPMFGGWGSAWSAAEIRTDTIIIVETLVYSLPKNKLVWAGQSKTTNPANLNRLIEKTAEQVADELVRQGLIVNLQSHR
jgi:hypothetical protein